MPETSMSQQPDLSPTIQRMNLLEKAELEKLGQKVDDEGNLISTEKKNKKSKRFKLLVALAFLGTSLLVNYQSSSASGSENKVDRLMTTILEEDDDAEETEQTEITSLTERLADFSTTHDFEIVQTNEDSQDHIEQLSNDDYAINFLFSRAQADIDNQIKADEAILGDEADALNMAEIMTDMYFRRDDLGNPVLGLYFNPEVVSELIQASEGRFFNLNFPIGWVEYTVTSSERRFPELHAYQLNGTEVFSENPNLFIDVDEDGNEILIEESYQEIDISSLPDDQRATFLVEEVGVWSEEEVEFLLGLGQIEEADAYWDDFDEVYYNDSSDFKYGPGQSSEGEPVRNGFNPVFLIPVTRAAETYDATQAAQIRAEGVVVDFDQPRNRMTQSYQEGAVFNTPEGTVTSSDNQALLYSIATDNPDKIIVSASGEMGALLETDSRPDNLVMVGLYMRGMSPQGADIYLNPDEEAMIVSSGTATSKMMTLFEAQNPVDVESFLSEQSTTTEVWRGSGDEAYEETIRVLN